MENLLPMNDISDNKLTHENKDEFIVWVWNQFWERSQNISEEHFNILSKEYVEKQDSKDDEQSLCDYAANRIAEKKVVGWFQGKMEWGPRALGNRSILADPRDSSIKDTINSKIKRRESFRPFAPSILFEEANNWFENFRDEEPFMSRVLKFKKNKSKLSLD